MTMKTRTYQSVKCVMTLYGPVDRDKEGSASWLVRRWKILLDRDKVTCSKVQGLCRKTCSQTRNTNGFLCGREGGMKRSCNIFHSSNIVERLFQKRESDTLIDC